MGQVFSNCLPQYPAQFPEQHAEEALEEEEISDNNSVESRGLKLHSKPELPPKEVTTPTPEAIPTQPTVKKPTSPKISTEEQDFFTDMKPKYAPPPIVNPKHISRLAMDDASVSHSAWDEEATDKGPQNDLQKKETRQKYKLDSTATNESFDDFDE